MKLKQNQPGLMPPGGTENPGSSFSRAGREENK